LLGAYATCNGVWLLELAERPYANEASLNPTTGQIRPTTKAGLLTGSWVISTPILKKRRRGGGDISPTLDPDAFYTEYVPQTVDRSDYGMGENPLRMMGPSNYPQSKAFWLDPLGYKNVEAKDYAALYTAQCRKVTLLGALVYPFVPLHAFSSFCPI
jgi:hypothetical protein